MPGRLAIDFGTSNTVLALWDESKEQGVAQTLPDYAKFFEQAGEEIPLVPSLIHYAGDDRRWLGRQVEDHNVLEHPGTFRWMKRYIQNRSPAKKKVAGGMRTNFDAGRDFLSSLLAVAVDELGAGGEEIALSVPVESFEHYDDWLTSATEAAGISRFRLIDEPSAAALGYGVNLQPEDVYLIFDFGGGTLDVAVVRIEEESAGGGRACRVLGKAGSDLGGTVIDGWLYMHVLEQNGYTGHEDTVRQVSNALLLECRRAKERLSSHREAEVTVVHPDTGATISAAVNRGDFEDLLDDHDAFTEIDKTLRRAMAAAAERGFLDEHIKNVLMVGGSSLVPSVRKTVQRIFGRDRVVCDRPMDAVARGAAAFVSGVDFFDHIQHSYAIRHVESATGAYHYTPVVEQGTPYPTAEPAFNKQIKAAYDGQTQLGIAIFEIAQSHRRGRSQQPMELVFDPSGAARIVEVTPDEEEQRSHFWMNEHHPTFLLADPPARRGEARFEVELNVDGNKRLLITARDLRSGKLTHKDFPVVKLT